MLRKRSPYTTMWLCLCVALPASYSLGESDSRLLEFVLTGNEQSVDTITSISYDFECARRRYDAPNAPRAGGHREMTGPYEVKGKFTVLQRGENRWSSHQYQKTWTNTGARQDAQYRTTVNDDYMATWPVGTKNAYQYDHEAISSMSPRSRVLAQLHGAENPLRYVLGSDKGGLRGLYEKVKKYERWEVEQVSSGDDRQVFRVERFSREYPNTQHPQGVLVVDPDKGFVVTHAVTYYQSGAIKKERDIVLAQATTEGLWMPKQIQEKRYYDAHETGAGSRELAEVWTIKIGDMVLNEAVDDRSFSLQSLEIDEGVILLRRTLDGELSSYIRIGDKFIPERLYREMQRAMERTTEAAIGNLEETAPVDDQRALEASDVHQEEAERPDKTEPPIAPRNDEPLGEQDTSVGSSVIAGLTVLGLAVLTVALLIRRKTGGQRE